MLVLAIFPRGVEELRNCSSENAPFLKPRNGPRPIDGNSNSIPRATPGPASHPCTRVDAGQEEKKKKKEREKTTNKTDTAHRTHLQTGQTTRTDASLPHAEPPKQANSRCPAKSSANYSPPSSKPDKERSPPLNLQWCLENFGKTTKNQHCRWRGAR